MRNEESSQLFYFDIHDIPVLQPLSYDSFSFRKKTGEPDKEP